MLRWVRGSLRRKIVLAMLAVAATPGAIAFWLAYSSAEEALTYNFSVLWDGWVAEDAGRLSGWIAARAREASAWGESEEFAAWLAALERGESPPPPQNVGELAGRVRAIVLFSPDARALWTAGDFSPSALEGARRRMGELRHLGGSARLGMLGWDALELESGVDSGRLAGLLAPVSRVGPDGQTEQIACAALLFDFSSLQLLLRVCPPRQTALVRLGGAAIGGLSARDSVLLAKCLLEQGGNVPSPPMAGNCRVQGMEIEHCRIFYHQVRAISAFSPQSGQTWYLATVADMEAIAAARDKFFWKSVLANGVLLAGVYLLALWLAGRIADPVLLLREDARKLAAGDLDSRVEALTSDELADLGRDINLMAERLGDARRDLELSVEEARRRAGQVEVIAHITAAMTAALTVEQTFANVAEGLRRLGGFDHCSLSLLDGPEEFRHLVADGFARAERPFPDDLLAKSIKWGPPRIFAAAKMKSLGAEGLQVGAIFPLATRDNPIGALCLASASPDAFSEEMAGDLAMVAECLAAAIRHHQLHEQALSFAEALERQVRQRTSQLEETHVQLLRAEKFAATGQLAANLAHEINNPLGIIRNHLQLLQERLRGKIVLGGSGEVQVPKEERWIAIIREEIERIARLTRSLLNFYRSTPGEESLVSLDKTAEEIVYLVRDCFRKKGIDVTFQPAGDGAETWMAADLFRQVLMNLLRNAEDAMEGREGKIEVILRPSAEDATEACPLGCVEMVVRDQGKGIPKANLSKIFDPFFTTKGAEKGTGLGLSVTFGIMGALGGSIAVESVEGDGAAFKLRFPIRKAPEGE